jgi:predicted porin
MYYTSIALIAPNGLTDSMPLPDSALNIMHQNGQGNSFGTRFNNFVGYWSPDFNGLSGSVGYSTSNGASGSEDLSPGLKALNRAYTLNPTYIKGPIKAFYAYFRADGVASSPTSEGQQLTAHRLGVSYTFPIDLQLGLAVDRDEIRNSDGSRTASLAVAGGAVAASQRMRTAWVIPVTYKTGPSTFSFVYGASGNVKTDLGSQQATGAKMLVAAYDYEFTNGFGINLSLSKINNDANAKYDYWHVSSNLGTLSSTGLPAGANTQFIAVGLRYAF